MKKYLKWIGIGFLALAVIGIFLPESSSDSNGEESLDSKDKAESKNEVIHWTQGGFVDEFGDSNGKRFLKYIDNEASFTNSAVTDENLIVTILLSDEIQGTIIESTWETVYDTFQVLRFRFDEYADGNLETFYGDWRCTFKLKDGTKRSRKLEVFSNELGISKEHTEEIMNELKEQRDVRFYISDDYATRYSFEIKGFNGFNEGIEEYGW
ncbi:MAG: hypothetical protein ACPGYF_02670 [Chitinophagales bacterium]